MKKLVGYVVVSRMDSTNRLLSVIVFRCLARILALALLANGLIHSSAFAQTPAFPGALGFGANVTGGRGGTVYHVTTLADSGPGSFRDAVSHSHRIIVFDVGGYITLNSAVSCSGDLTIAGQTAPGGGIGFRGGEISFSSRSNVICRYIRVRPGSETASHTDDALAMANARTMIFDHCSFEFGPWNNIDAVTTDWQTTPVTEVTFQNCLDADPSKNVTADSTSGQQFGAHTESPNSQMSWIYSAFANSHNRNPLAKINNVFVNNVDYNCSMGYTTHTSTSFSHDIVNNYFIAGPAYGSSTDFPWYQVDDNQSIYYSGNLFDANEDSTLNGSITTPYWYQGGTGTILSSPWSSITPAIPTYSAATAYRLVISQVGALPRDPIDNLVISQMKTLGNGTTGTGAGTAGPDSNLYSDQTQTGLGNNGYGVINGGIPAADSDGDGMPDYWEKATGLNYLSAGDAMTIGSDGYANIERYINWLGGPHAVTVTNTSVDVDLWQYTSGFTNANQIYYVDNSSNGVVSLINGHIAHFTPNVNFSGLGGFQFTVMTSDSAYSNVVNVLVTPQTTSSGGANLTWVGDGISNAWIGGSGTNWFNGTNLVSFNNNDTVTFDDTGSAAPPIQLSGTLAPAAVYVIANDQDYTFAGTGWIAGPAALFKTGAGNLFINTTNTFNGGVKIDEGTVQLGDGVSANGSLAGDITNNDTLIYDNPGSVANSVNISGSGVLIKDGSGTLTLSGTQTYTNTTTINSGALQFSGTIPPGDIVDNGTLILAPSGSVTVNNFIQGSGSVSINASGPTTLSGLNSYAGGTTNVSGTLNVGNNFAIGSGPVTHLSGSVHIADGTVITNTFVVPSSTSDSMMDCVSGTATWAGDIVLTGGGAQFRPSGVNGTLVLTGHGSFGNRNFIIPRGSVHFASNADFSAGGTASSFDRNSTGNSAFITVEDNASVSFAQFSLGGGQASGGRIILTLNDNATFSVSGNFDLLNSTASSAVSSVNLDGGTLAVGGFIKSHTGSSQLSTNFFNGGILRANGDNASFLPALTGFQAIVKSGGAMIDDGGFAITIAAALVHDPTLGAAADGGLTKLGTGTLTLASGASTFTGPISILAGTLVWPFSSSLGRTNLYIAAGAILDSMGTFDNVRTLSGNGSIKNSFTLGAGAILSPGSNSTGTLTFDNSLTLSSAGRTIIALNPSSQTNSSVLCEGTLTEGGTLVVTNLGGTFSPGDRFQLFNAGTFNGVFNNFVLPSLAGNMAWNTSRLNVDGTLWVVSTSPPAISQTRLSGSNIVFSGTGGTPNWYYEVLETTNLSMPAVQWTPVVTNQFDANGNFIFSNTANPAWPQTFYRLQSW